MNWWCSATRRTWEWTPRPYVGAWVVVGAVVGLAVWWALRGRRDDALLAAQADAATRSTDGAAMSLREIAGSSRGRTIALVFGALGLWAVLDWPLATLGAGYLAIAQMARQIWMIMVVAPLLLFACPAPLAVRLFGWKRRLTVLRWASRPIVAVPVAAGTLIGVNAPAIVDPLLKTPYGAFAMDLAWIIAGFVLWLPVQCPHPGVRRLEGPTALMYLIGQSIVPVLPGFFMTWADFPIYETYDLAPRAIAGFDAVQDQQAAAAVLQVGGMVLLWIQISYRFLTWGYREMDYGPDGHRKRGSPGSPSGPLPGATAPS